MSDSEIVVARIDEGGDAPLSSLKVKPIRRLSEAPTGTWSQIEVEFPDENPEVSMNDRVGHTLISIPEREQMLMMGGGNHHGDIDQVWKLETTEDGRLRCSLQTNLTIAFPGRYEFFCGVNEENSQVWIFGGADLASPRNDVCTIDLESGTILNPFAGTTEGTHDDPNVPVARTQGTNSCVVKIKDEEYLAVFGGGMQCEKAVPDGNLYLYKLSDGTWRRVEVTGSTPNPVQGHGMVAIGTTVFVHGGMNEFILSADSYLIDLSVEIPSWVKVPVSGFKPHARAAYGIAAIGNDIIICGGLGDEGAMADLWKFNIESKEWSLLNTGKEEAIKPRLDFALTTMAVPVNGQLKPYILVHGGMNTYGNIYKDFWVYPLEL